VVPLNLAHPVYTWCKASVQSVRSKDLYLNVQVTYRKYILLSLYFDDANVLTGCFFLRYDTIR